MVPGLILLLIVWAVLLFGLHLAGLMIATLDLASVFVVLGGTLALLLCSFSLRDIAAAVRFLLSRDTAVPRRKAILLSELYSAAADYGLYTGLLGSYIGMVLILQTVDNPTYLGPKFAVCSVTYFYGFFIYALALLAGRKLSLCMLTDGDYRIRPRKQVLWMAVGAAAFLAIMVLGIMSGGDTEAFIEPAALVLVLGGSLTGMLLLVPIGDLLDSCRLLLGRDVIAEERAVKAMGVFDQFNDIVVSLIVIGAGAGAIGVLQSFGGAPDFGPYLAFALMVVFYGAIIICFSRAKQCITTRALAEVGLRVISAPRFSASWLAGISLVLYLLTIAALLFLFLPVEA